MFFPPFCYNSCLLNAVVGQKMTGHIKAPKDVAVFTCYLPEGHMYMKQFFIVSHSYKQTRPSCNTALPQSIVLLPHPSLLYRGQTDNSPQLPKTHHCQVVKFQALMAHSDQNVSQEM